MKKTHIMLKRAGVLLMALLLLTGSVPAGAEDFSDGMQTELGDGQEQEGDLEDFSGEDDNEEDVFSEPEDEFSSEDTTEEEQESDENIQYIMGRPLTEEERQEQLAPFDNLSSLGSAPDI